jgi:hypothetical protein
MELTSDMGEDSGGGQNCTKLHEIDGDQSHGKQRVSWYFVQISCSGMLLGTHCGAS